MVNISRTRWLQTKAILGWSFALILPLWLHLVMQKNAVPWESNYFLTFFMIALIMWMLQLTPMLPPIFMLISSFLLLGIVPGPVLLSGFISSAFFLIFGLMVFSAVVVKSGLLTRLSYLILKHLPNRLWCLELFLIIVGAFTSIFINAQVNRFDLAMPIYQNFLEETGCHHDKTIRKALSLALYFGGIYFSEFFFVGKTSNIAMFSMLPQQVQAHFTVYYWSVAASVPVIIMLLPLLICYFAFYRKKRNLTVNHTVLAQKLQELGPLSYPEQIAIGAIALLFVGIVLSCLHIVSLAWFCVLLLFFLLLFPILDRKDFRVEINWSFLFYVGGIIGVVASIRFLHLDTAAFGHFPSVAVFAKASLIHFFIIAIVVSVISTLLVGTVASTILLYPLLLPMMPDGVNPWILVFIILMACEIWFFSYQSTYQLYLEELNENYNNVEIKPIIKMNIFFGLCRIIALFASIPFWHYLGLL